MAQKLKEELREAIIKAAKQEFLEKGYKGASMRSIAKKANMTVGNLYRYYKNKEDINLSIVAPTFKKIDSAIKALNSKDVTMEIRMFDLKPNVNDLRTNYDNFANDLVDIYFSNKEEFNILLLHSRISEELVSKFKDMVLSLLSESYDLKESLGDLDRLATAYANSLFAGLQAIFKGNDYESDNLKKLIKIYFRSFIYMLDSDTSRFINNVTN